MKLFQPFSIVLFVSITCFTPKSFAQLPELNRDFWHTHPAPTYAIAEDSVNNVVYYGGSGFINQIYPNKPFGIAFDKESGSPLIHVKAPNAIVKAAVADGNGGWYIGGDFTEVGGIPRMHLAQFDADGNLTDWNPSANGSVSVLRIIDNLLYVGGDFSALGGKSRLKAASFDLASGALTDWSPNVAGQRLNDIGAGNGKAYLGGLLNRVNLAGLNGGAVDSNTGDAAGYSAFPDGKVSCSAYDGNGGFFIGGLFSNVAGIARQNIAHIDAEGNVSAWNPGANGEVKTLKLQDSTLLVGGSFTEIAGAIRRSAAALHPTTGEALPWNPRFAGEVLSIDIAEEKIFVGGSYSAAGQWTANGGQVDGITGVLFFSEQFPDGTVRAAISDGQGGWFIGGEFLNVGTTPRERIAHINASGQLTDWYPGPVNSTVRGLHLVGNRLFFTGDFSTIGFVSRQRLAVVDSQTAELLPWNTFPNGPIDAMLTHEDVLYLGGGFVSMGNISRQRLAAVDPITGEVLPLSITSFGNISALEVKDDRLFLGGTFTTINGVQRNRIACIDINSGQLLDWNPNANNNVLALAILNNTIYVGGTFTNIAGLSRIRIAAIDINTGIGTPWAPSNSFSSTPRLVVAGNTVYAGGNFLRTNGTVQVLVAALHPITGAVLDWDPKINSPLFLSTLAVDGNSVYIGGNIPSFGGDRRRSASAFDLATGDLQTWDPMLGGNPIVVNAIQARGEKVFFGGQFSTVGGISKTSLAAVDINTAEVSPWNLNLNGAGQVRVITGSGNTVFVGGSFTSVGGTNRNRLAAINALTGTVAAFNAGVQGVGEVSALSLHEDVLYVGGGFGSIAGVTQLRAAALNASSGAILPWNPNMNFGTPQTLAYGDGKVYIGGTSGSSWGGSTTTNIVAVDATEGLLEPFDVNPSGEVMSMLVDDSILYFGGIFQQVNSTSRSNFAAINTLNQELTPLNPSFNGSVRSIISLNENLWIGGGFSTLNGSNRRSLAVIGKSSGLVSLSTPAFTGGFLGAEVNSIDIDNGVAYLTGRFINVGGVLNPYLASLNAHTGTLNTWNANIDGIGTAVAAAGSTVFVGGEFIRAGLRPAQGLVAFSTADGMPNGFELPLNGYITALKVHNNMLYVGGGFSQFGGQPRTNLAAVDLNTGALSDWAPQVNSEVFELEAFGDLIFVSGEFATANGQPRQSLAAFHSQTGALDPFNASIDGFVYSLQVAEGKLYVGGFFNQVQGQTRTYLAAFDAGSKALLPFNPIPNGEVGSFAFANQTLYVAGNFTQIAGQPRANVAALNTQTDVLLDWDPNISPFSIQHIAAWKDQLILGGLFTQIQGQPRFNLASVSLADASLSDWNPNPQSTTNNSGLFISKLVSTPDRLYVVGNFERMEGQIVGSPAVFGASAEGCVIEPLCQSFTLVLENGELTLLNPADIDAGSTATCEIATLSVQPIAFGPENLGPNAVTLTVTDALGNSASCEAVVTVVNAEPLSIQCPENSEVSCTLGTDPEITGFALAASPCGIAALEYTDALNSEGCSITIMRTWTATDSCGFTLSCEQLIVQLFDEAPQVIAPIQTTAGLTCSALQPDDLETFFNGQLGEQEATSFEQSLHTLFSTYGLLPSGVAAGCSDAQLHALGFSLQPNVSCPVRAVVQARWVALDSCGNSSDTLTTSIVVSDMTTPVIFGAPDIVLPCGSPITPEHTGFSLASDNCVGGVQLNYTDTPLGSSCPFSIIRLWTASDACGNTATYEQFITLTEQPLECISPPGGLSAVPVAANTVALSWNPVPGSVACRVFGRLAGTGGSVTVATITGNEPTFVNLTHPLLTNGREIEWRVVCACSTEPLVTTPFSAWSSFVFFLQQGIVINEMPTTLESKLQVYPNPSDGIATVLFTPSSSGRTTLEMFDLSGRQIEVLFDAQAEANHDVSLRLVQGHLPNGVYLIRLTTGAGVEVKRLVISR